MASLARVWPHGAAAVVLGCLVAIGCAAEEDGLALLEVTVAPEVPAFDRLRFSIPTRPDVPAHEAPNPPRSGLVFGYYVSGAKARVEFKAEALTTAGCGVGEGRAYAEVEPGRASPRVALLVLPSPPSEGPCAPPRDGSAQGPSASDGGFADRAPGDASDADALGDASDADAQADVSDAGAQAHPDGPMDVALDERSGAEPTPDAAGIDARVIVDAPVEDAEADAPTAADRTPEAPAADAVTADAPVDHVPDTAPDACPSLELACGDGIDDDCDGKPDCEDSDCADRTCGLFGRVCGGTPALCSCPGGAVEAMCGNGVDDDCDGQKDCMDPDCEGASCGLSGQRCGIGSPMCTCPGGQVENACDDGADNDCDGKKDCEDADCASHTCGMFGRTCTGDRTCACPGGTKEDACEDGKDNDCDGVRDCADPDCDGTTCGTFGRRCSTMAAMCVCPGAATESACGDGVDNDCDGATDCGDPDCRAPGDRLFAAAGTSTFQVPACVSTVTVTVVGGGGGGGGGFHNGGTPTPDGTGFGGQRGAISTQMLPVTPGAAVQIAVGAAGPGGPFGNGDGPGGPAAGMGGQASSFGALVVGGGAGGQSAWSWKTYPDPAQGGYSASGQPGESAHTVLTRSSAVPAGGAGDGGAAYVDGVSGQPGLVYIFW